MCLRFGWRAFTRVFVLIPTLFFGSNVFLSNPAMAQQSALERGLYISGYVRDEANQSLKTISLELLAETGTVAAPSVVTGTDGQFQFNGVSSGNYSIVAHAKGYDSVNLSVMVGGVPLTNVIVTLRRSDSAKEPTLGDPISAHQLSIPDKARDLFEKGVKQLTSSKPDYHKAVSFFDRAIREYPDFYESYAEMGIAYHRLGDVPNAEQALRKSAELSAGRYADALLMLAQMLNDNTRFQDAEPFARQCVSQDESSWRCDLELARSLAGRKHATEAEVIAVKASELNPNSAQVFLVLGNIHIQEKNYPAVVKDFESYLKLDPSGPQSDQVRASAEQARRAANRAPAVPAQLPQ